MNQDYRNGQELLNNSTSEIIERGERIIDIINEAIDDAGVLTGAKIMINKPALFKVKKRILAKHAGIHGENKFVLQLMNEMSDFQKIIIAETESCLRGDIGVPRLFVKSARIVVGCA